MENTSLVAAFREKNRKHQQTQELYDRLKRKEMTSATQTAAYNSVDEVLGSVTHRQGQNLPNIPHQYETGTGSEGQAGSNGSHGDSRMMPPPSYRMRGNEPKAPDIGIFYYPFSK